MYDYDFGGKWFRLHYRQDDDPAASPARDRIAGPDR
jgi:hypothetical protein